MNDFRCKLTNYKNNNIIKYVIIVVMALTQNECKEDLFDCLINSGINITHFILTAEKETIKSRINADESRDKNFSLEFLSYL